VPTHRGGTVKLTVVLYEEVVTVDHPRQEQSFTKADRFLATPSHRETDMRKTAYRPNRLYHRIFAKVISHGTAPISDSIIVQETVTLTRKIVPLKFNNKTQRLT